MCNSRWWWNSVICRISKFFINPGDRVICSSAISSMGTGLQSPLVYLRVKNLKMICIIGDGSFLMNVQDLQTIKQDNINVVILINNNGYLAIIYSKRIS